MTLRPGCRVIVAPSFHLPVSGPAPGQSLPDCLSLFQVPRHLLAAWGRLLERAERTGAARLDGFDGFVADIAAFLAFKDLPVPEGAVFDLRVSAPGLRSVPRAGAPAGLAFSLPPETPFPPQQ